MSLMVLCASLCSFVHNGGPLRCLFRPCAHRVMIPITSNLFVGVREGAYIDIKQQVMEKVCTLINEGITNSRT